MQKGLEATNEDFVSLETLSQLTGFPIEFITNELFEGSKLEGSEVRLDDLREAMLKYVDSTMILEKESH
jgi:hypothetical protein